MPVQAPIHVYSNQDGAAAGKLLAKEPELKANFSRAQGAGSNAKANKVARFLPNPEANWGPKPKHGRAVKVRNLCTLSMPTASGCSHVQSHFSLSYHCLLGPWSSTHLSTLQLCLKLAKQRKLQRTSWEFAL